LVIRHSGFGLDSDFGFRISELTNDPMSDLRNSSNESLARILDDDSATAFDDHDIAPMLAHQLSAPIQFDVELLSGELSRKLIDYRAAAAGKPMPARFADLLFAPHPPIELLDLVKQFAKANRSHGDGPMQKIAGVLYYASILAARLRCHGGQRISQLSDAELATGVGWALDQPWIDARTRGLFEEGRAFLGGSNKSPPQK
jgi:hypothetical protein